MRRGPIDRRLWRPPSGAKPITAFRWWLIGSVLIGLASTAGLIAQASLLATAISAAMTRAQHPAMRPALAGLALVTLGRAALTFAGEHAATGAAQRTAAELRARALRALLGRQAAASARATGDVAMSLGHGLDALDGYLGRYLPRVVLGALAPVMLLAWIAWLDPLSAAILGVTLVLLPVFMVLVGQLTASKVTRRWAALGALSGQFLDAVEGLATLRAFDRIGPQRRTIAAASERLRVATLGTLRLALLSALVLETLAAVGTALVAVPLGLRLLGGTMPLATALTVLILTPEVYLPLRRAAAEFHASTDGAAALDAVFAVIEPRTDSMIGVEPDHAAGGHAATSDPGRRAVADARRTAAAPPPRVELRAVRVRYPGRAAPALGPLDLHLAAGEHLGVTGPSGAGKSTLVNLLVGLVEPDTGHVHVDGRDLVRHVDLASWRERIAWVPQRPTLRAGTIAENLRLGAPRATDAELWRALDIACLADVVANLPGGLRAELAEHAEGLSAGERQRLALARALARRDADLLVLDEPTAHLDPDTEAELVARLRPTLANRSALIVTHRQPPLRLADRTLTLLPPLPDEPAVDPRDRPAITPIHQRVTPVGTVTSP